MKDNRLTWLLWALGIAGWSLAWGLWFKSDYAWAKMREAKKEVEDVKHELKLKDFALDACENELHETQADAYRYMKRLTEQKEGE